MQSKGLNVCQRECFRTAVYLLNSRKSVSHYVTKWQRQSTIDSIFNKKNKEFAFVEHSRKRRNAVSKQRVLQNANN